MNSEIKMLMAVAVAGAMFAGQSVQAETFTLTIPNTNTIGAGPFATVEKTLATCGAFSCVNFDVTASSGYQLIDGSAFAFNGTSSTFAISPVTITGGSATSASVALNQNVDGFGVFTYAIDLSGSPPTANELQFTVSNTTGNVTLADVDLDNASGHMFAAHVLCTASNPANCTGNTGFVTNGGAPPPGVPEPASLLLLGTGLAGIGAWAWKRQKSA